MIAEASAGETNELVSCVDSENAVVVINKALLYAIDRWIAEHGSQLSRPEAIQILLSDMLKIPLVQTPTLDEEIARTREDLNLVKIPKELSPERGLAMLRKGYVENKLRSLEAQRGER